MGFFKEFKDFAVKGNLIDIAVGLVMATAFGKVVSAFVDGMFMPVVGKLVSGVDFTKMKFVIQNGVGEVKDAAGAVITPAMEEVAIKYGSFITSIIDFTIVAFIMFLIIKAINKSKAAEPAPPTPAQEVLLGEIRDLLKK